ncbi:MAG: hypothetical protein J07AB43_10830 [Candidatus Nanosalina sp. J07AB43]|nr:MAG: hypothetical protein J07AB43_10830 [Candidatus Nanosalina sp. J07AB43]
MEPKLDYAIDSGSKTSRKTNEDYLWVGAEEGINSVLILDGTSGVAGDFVEKNGKTGGRRYVEEFGAAVKQILERNPQENLESVMKSAVEMSGMNLRERHKRTLKSISKEKV